MIRYEYRCVCGWTELVDAATKAAEASEDGSVLHRACPSALCVGPMKRVWGAGVQTTSVPGFYAHGAANVPKGEGTSD